MTAIGKIVDALEETLRDAEDINADMLAFLIKQALIEARDVRRQGDIGVEEASSPISPPKRQDAYPDRYLDCQMALEHALQDLVEKGIGAGWRPDEVLEAIEALCTANGRGRGENGAVNAHLMLANIMAKRKQQ